MEPRSRRGDLLDDPQLVLLSAGRARRLQRVRREELLQRDQGLRRGPDVQQARGAMCRQCRLPEQPASVIRHGRAARRVVRRDAVRIGVPLSQGGSLVSDSLAEELPWGGHGAELPPRCGQQVDALP